MKVLYIGNYSDIPMGWAKAAQENILAMDSVGIDVVPRKISFTNSQTTHPRIKELETKSDKNCDVCIQHVLPHMSHFSGNFRKNIIMFATETDNFRASGWRERVNCFDSAIVFSEQSRQACINTGVTIPVDVVPHPIDTQKFQRSFKKLDLPILPGTFVFLFVGEFNRRKNLSALIKAFHVEFNINEPVQIVIKSNPESGSQLSNFINEIKKGLNLFPNVDYYKPEIIITETLTEEQIIALHYTSDVLVIPSRGEGFYLPGLDSIAIGKPVICTDKLCEYITNDNGWKVKSRIEPYFGIPSTTNVSLYSAKENGFEIDILDLRKCLRESFQNKKMYEEKSKNALNSVEKYSYENIGKKFVEILNDKK